MAEKVKLTPEKQKQKEAKLLPITSFLQDYKANLGDGSKKYRGIVSGFTEIDNKISGLDRFILLAGRSGAGKTTLALQLALGVAQQGTPVLIYSLEMSRDEIITKLVQDVAHSQGNSLFASTIDLNGNSPTLDSMTKQQLEDALKGLADLGDLIYIRDGRNGTPSILPKRDGNGKPTDEGRVYKDVVDLKAKHNAERVLVIIDSIQDIVPDSSNQVQAEVKTLADLTELQQSTNATLLVTAQKNKASKANNDDDYGDVMGSMSYIHKPNTVLMLDTPRETLGKQGGGKNGGLTAEQKKELDKIDEHEKLNLCKPMVLKITKGRFTGASSIPLTFYGAYGYFTGENIGYNIAPDYYPDNAN